MAAGPDEPKLEFSVDDKKLFAQVGGKITVGRFILSATSKTNFVHFEKIVRNEGEGGDHAEILFLAIANRLIDPKEQYSSISLDIKINYSPCGDCRSELEGFLRKALTPEGKLSLKIAFAMVYYGDITESITDAAECKNKRSEKNWKPVIASHRLKKWKEILKGAPIKASTDLDVLFIATGPSRDPEFQDVKDDYLWSSREKAEKNRNGLLKYAKIIKGIEELDESMKQMAIQGQAS